MCVVPILYCLPGVAWPGVGSSRGRGKGATGRQAGRQAAATFGLAQ